MKQPDSKLRSAGSEENIHHLLISLNGTNGDYLNCETESLDAELVDPSCRSCINSDDADIWSTGDETTGDAQ